MKFKIIASVIVIVIVIVALFIKGANNNQTVDENGNPIETTQQQ